MNELCRLRRSEGYGACDDDAGFGEAPQQAFLQRPRDAKIASVATLALLAVSAIPRKQRKNTMKTHGSYRNRSIYFFYKIQ